MKSPFTVKRSYHDSSVKVLGSFKAGGFREPAITTQIAADISTADARALAAAMIAEADVSDEKARKKAEVEDRRTKWQDREVAAGRLVRMNITDLLGRR